VTLLRLALTVPRFDAEAVERIRSQLLAELSRSSTNPNEIANRRFWATAFPDHPYGRPSKGTPETVSTITADDLKTYVKSVFAREQLTVGIVGDLSAEAAGKLIDRVFGDLPGKPMLAPVPGRAIQGLGERIVINLDVPQTVINFGGPGVARDDSDFMAAYIVNHIYGAGTHTSRLYNEVREKRGLAYSIRSTLYWMDSANLIVGGTATRSDRAGETLSIIDTEMKRIAAEGPTQDELDKAKAYLKGSYALGFDTSAKIAGQLVHIQMDGFGPEWLIERNRLIEAVTMDDARRVCGRLFGDGALGVAIVGRPAGI